jgi:hypothetical protein
MKVDTMTHKSISDEIYDRSIETIYENSLDGIRKNLEKRPYHKLLSP